MNENVITAIATMNAYGKAGIPFLFIIDFELENPLVYQLHQLTNEGIRFMIGATAAPYSGGEIQFIKHPLDYRRYQTAFNYVLEKIRGGYSYLTNLTFPTPVETNLSLAEIFIYSSARYKLLVRNRFVVFSPESFVRIKDGKISSFPMKGTLDAALPNAEYILLTDDKEMAEHCTIVDLIRNDLNMVAKKVRVEKFRYIERIRTNQKELLQTSSHIVGDLEGRYWEHFGDILFAMLPAGSVSGAPKRKTVEIIQAAEKGKRGYYTGVFGYCNGKNLDSAVMIRFIEQTEQGMLYRSGGGLTFLSDPVAEYQELIDKVYVPVYRNHQRP